MCFKTSNSHKSTLVEFGSQGRVCFLTLLAGRKCRLFRAIRSGCSGMLPYNVPSVFFVKNQVSGCLKCGCKEPKLRANLDAPCHPQSQTQTDREVQLPVLQASWTAMRHSTHLIRLIHVTWFKAKPKPGSHEALKQIKLKVTIKKRYKKPNDE